MQRMAGVLMFEANGPTHPPEIFWRRFRMNKELFIEVVQGLREK
jgi:hypothetical protein